MGFSLKSIFLFFFKFKLEDKVGFNIKRYFIYFIPFSKIRAYMKKDIPSILCRKSHFCGQKNFCIFLVNDERYHETVRGIFCRTL